MATSGVTCVVRQGFVSFIHSRNTGFLLKNTQKLLKPGRSVICPCSTYCTTAAQPNDVTVEYRHGLSVFKVPLPSRKESCEFVLKPVSHTVKDFVNFLREEDKGIDRVAIYNQDGTRVSSSTTLDILLRSNFRVVINEEAFAITPPTRELAVPTESIETFNEVREMTAKLYSFLNVEEYQIKKENVILQQLEDYRLQIEPYQRIKAEFEEKINSSNNVLTYVGATIMGLQFGFFSRLTWWEYSWDVMEPVTYFATYASLMVWYAYYVITSQEYTYVDAWDREFVRKFYIMARKEGFDVEEYNRLARLIEQCESDLRRLRDPLQMHLPIREL